MEWLKADFHLHSREDRCDIISHTACELIDCAAALDYRVLAIANHRFLTFSPVWEECAQERGILLIPAVEANILGRHVVVLNAGQEADRLRTFEDLAAYRRSHDVVVIAPHPFYYSFICLRKKLYQHTDLFDAVEIHHFYTRFFNPNKKAEKFARQYSKPLVGNSDCHRLGQLGLTYSRVLADQTVSSVLKALRQGDVQVVTQPLAAREALGLLTYLRIGQLKRLIRRFYRFSREHPDESDLEWESISDLHSPSAQSIVDKVKQSR